MKVGDYARAIAGLVLALAAIAWLTRPSTPAVSREELKSGLLSMGGHTIMASVTPPADVSRDFFETTKGITIHFDGKGHIQQLYGGDIELNDAVLLKHRSGLEECIAVLGPPTTNGSSFARWLVGPEVAIVLWKGPPELRKLALTVPPPTDP